MASSVPQEVKDLVKQEEGFRDDVYPDAEGYAAGYGHFLSEEELKKYPPGTKVPQDQIDAWFEEDISRSYAAAQAQNQQLPRPVDIGRLTSVNYQLGESWYDINVNPKAFKDTWAKMKAGDYAGASIAALDSEWARTQTPGRAKKFSDALASLGQGSGTEPIPSGPTASAPEPTPSDPTASGFESPVSSLLSGSTRTYAPPGSPSSRVFAAPGDPGSLVARVGVQQEVAAAGFTSPYADQSIRLAPAGIVPRFKEAVSAGTLQQSANIQRFGAIYNLLAGDEEAAQSKLNRAEHLSDAAGEMLSRLGTFEQFLEAPTVGGFFDQISKALGQFTTPAITSISTGLGGVAVQMLGRGALSIASRKVTNEVMKDIVKKHVLAQQGRGPALSRSEQRILDAAYDTAKKARAGQGELFGPSPTALVAAGTRDSGKRASLQYGFLAGAGAQEYVSGSAQSLAEFEEAGRELTDEESRLALAMGIPQTALGLIADKLFIGDIFKRVAGKHADAVRRGATKQADEYAGWMAEIAKGAVSGFAKGATSEGLTELAQEELFIQQRFAIDSEYNQTEANLRRAESAFAGFFAGGTARSPAGAIGNVVGKARAYTTSGRSAVEDLLSGVEDVPRDGSPINEPTSWAAAQITALLDSGTGTRAVWLPNATAASATAAIETATGGNLEAAEKLEIVVGQNENKGILIYDPDAVPDAGQLAIETDFSEGFLQDILGYTQLQDPTDTRAVIVRDNQGNVVWSQSVAEDNVDATVARAAELFPDKDKYKEPEVQFKEDAVKERWQKAQEEAQGQRQAGDQQTEFDFDEAQPEQATPEQATPEQAAFDFGDPQDGTPFRTRSMDGTGSDATFVPDTEDLTETDTVGEGRITDPLRKKDMQGLTEEEIAEARAERPVSAWPPRDPEERIPDKEFETRKEAEDFFLKYQAAELGVEFLDTTQTLEMGGSSVVIDNNLGRSLKTMPTAFLERFKEEAEQNPSLLLTPKENPDTKKWEIATTPRDVLTRNTRGQDPAERIPDVITKAASHKNRRATPGWVVRDTNAERVASHPAKRSRIQDRPVYMGTLIHYGLEIRERDGSNIKGTGRVTDGFNNVYQVLRDNGYELRYRGEAIDIDSTIADGQLDSLGFDRQKFIAARATAKIEYEKKSPVHREGTESGRDRVGQHQWARRNQKTGVIHINEKFLKQKFNGKAWTKPSVEGVNPLPEDAFSTLEEFKEFIILHEVGHSLVARADGREAKQQGEAAPSTVNIWAGTKENAELSNLAVRPFTDTQGRRYQSVEHAYQTHKSGEFDGTVYNNPKWGTGPRVKIVGQKGTKTEANWNIKLMGRIMRASFEQNPEAQQALLATGNAVLTHTQDRGVWRTKFPELLTSIRNFYGEQSDGRTQFDESYAAHENRINDAALIALRINWPNAPIYDLGGGRIVSLNEAQKGRAEIQDPDAPTDAELREELAALNAKWDARQRYFDEREANPGVPIPQMENPYVEVTEKETARKFEIERILDKGLQDRTDFVDEINPRGEFAPREVAKEYLDPTQITLSNVDLRTQAERDDPVVGAEQRARKKVGPKRGGVEIDSSWNNAVLGGLWPQLASILKSKLGYGGRDTRIHTVQGLQADFAAEKVPSWMRKTVIEDGQERTVSEILQRAVEEMRDPEAGNPGKYIRFGDTDLIIIDVPANPTTEEQIKSVSALGHELGHAIFHQEVDRALNNPKLRNDLIKAWEKDRDAGISDSYKEEFGFEEWFADNLGGWLLREAQKPVNGVESFFKRLADKIRSVFNSLNENFRARFRRNESFDTYVQDVIKSYKDGIPDNNGPPTPSKVIVRNMVDELADTVKPFMPKKALQQIKRKIVDLLSVKEELMPNDNRHWSVAYFLQPAHNYLRKFSPELANVFYSMSQSEEKAGHLNARVLLMYQRLNELWKLAPTKETITGKTVPDLDAFETVLREAEDDRTPTSQLSPEAQRVRQYLDDFYENYIVGKDSSVGKLTHFYPRILALAEIQANPEIQANLVALLQEFNPEGPKDVLKDSQGRDVSSFEGIVEALVREGQDNPDNVVPDIADVALGTSESRAKYFKNIPNSRLREIGALEQANTSIRRYVEDMTKRLDYLDKSRTVLTAADISNIRRAERDVQGAFSGAKRGDEVRGWKATEVMLSRISNETDRAAARDAVKAMLGKTGLGMSPLMRNINSVALSVNIVTYLTFATLASLPDLAGPILRSKDLSWDNLREGAKQARRYFTETQEMQQFARDIGVVTFDSLNTSLMQSSELGHMTPTAQRASDLFFKAIGLEWFTNFTRVFAAGMGEQFLIRQANLNTDRSSRFLRELGVSREDIKVWDQNGRTFGTPEGKRVQMALGRFVEESIVRPNAAERPVWASNPYTAIIWQLKSFFYAYGKNIVGGSWREANNRYAEDGTLSSASIPLVLGALTILPLTMVGLEIREWFKYLGRGGDEAAFRSDKMEWGEYSGDIIDRAGVLGPFGLILPIIEAGEFGNSWWVPPLGPSAERLEDLARGTAKLSDYMPGYAAIR